MNVSILLLVSAIVIFDSLNEILATSFLKLGNRDPDSILKLIQDYQYPVEVHTMETLDRYLLEMHRIPRGVPQAGKDNTRNRKPIPVLLQHGLLGSSADFVMLEPTNSLAFALADMGFDVWLGNIRGNIYSTGHSRLSPKEKKFWDFTWHESGIYDLPTQIDYICNKTGASKIYYIGYSLGTTVFFVMASSLPEYNNKIEKAFLMAPLAYLKHTKSPLIKNLSPFSKSIKTVIDFKDHGIIFSQNQNSHKALRFFCLHVMSSLCSNAFYFLNGADVNKYDRRKMSVFLNYYPASYSIKGMNHFSQLVTSGKFRQYDYGPKQNKVHYGTSFPPPYNVTAITADVYFIVAPNDKMSTFPDAVILGKKIPSLKKIHVVEQSHFDHFDFILNEHSKELVYDKIFGEMEGDMYGGRYRSGTVGRKNSRPCIRF